MKIESTIAAVCNALQIEKHVLAALVAASGAVLLVFVAIFALPSIEEAQDEIVGDVAITRTCFDRHGYNFIGRWSCRSALHQIGLVGLGFSCGFYKDAADIDICVNLNKASAENRRIKAENKRAGYRPR